MSQEQAQQPQRKSEEDAPLAVRKLASFSSDVDDLLDELDDVLEEDAETFVKEYVQLGGQ